MNLPAPKIIALPDGSPFNTESQWRSWETPGDRYATTLELSWCIRSMVVIDRKVTHDYLHVIARDLERHIRLELYADLYRMARNLMDAILYSDREKAKIICGELLEYIEKGSTYQNDGK